MSQTENPTTHGAGACRRSSTGRPPFLFHLVWVSQLVFPFVGLVYCWLRLRKGAGLGQLDSMVPQWSVVLGAILVGAWVFLVVASLVITRVSDALAARWRQASLLVVSVWVSLIACDLVLTATGLVPTLKQLKKQSINYEPSCTTISRLTPGQIRSIPAWPESRVEINDRGYRSPSVVLPKPAGRTRIAFLGGSQVFGHTGGNWPVRAAEMLRSSGFDVDVINAATPSHTTCDSLGKLYSDLWTFDIDCLLLCQGWNDIKLFRLLDENHSVLLSKDGFTHEVRYEANHPFDYLFCFSAFYRKARLRFFEHIGPEGGVPRELHDTFSEYGPRQYRINVELISAAARTIGAELILVKQPRLPVPDLHAEDREMIRYEAAGLTHDALCRAFDTIDKILEEVALEHGHELIDAHASLSGDRVNFADHIHFSNRGAAAASQLFADAVVRILNGRESD